MSAIRDRFNQFRGRTRFVGCRLMVQLTGPGIIPVFEVLQRAGQQALDAEGDLYVLGQGLVEICQTLLQQDAYWSAAANEGDIFWEEKDASQYINDLFSDSAQRYLSDIIPPAADGSDDFFAPITPNLVVMLTAAYQGEEPALETNLASLGTFSEGLRALINLHYQERLEAIQVHWSPASPVDALTDEQLLLNFAELIPL